MELGLGLMARFVGSENGYLTNYPLSETGARWGVYKQAVVTGFPWTYAQLTPPNPAANFPYGFQVEPDDMP